MGQFITLTKAVEKLKELGYPRARTTIIKWCKKHRVGHKLGPTGDWIINENKLIEFVTTGKVENGQEKPSGIEQSGEASKEESTVETKS